MKYNQPHGVTDSNAGYTNGNPATGAAGSIPPAAAIEHPQREIVHVIQFAGLTPDPEDLEQLRKAINILAGGGGGGPVTPGAYLPLAGGTMDLNADATFRGTGDPVKNGKAYWHPDNDGAESGLDADRLDGIDSSQFVRNDTDFETVLDGKIRVVKDASASNRAVLQLLGRDGQPGGARMEFLSGAGDTLNFLLYHAIDRRSIGGQMYSNNGPTFEDQFRFSDDGDLWLRKINTTVSTLGRVHYAATVAGVNDLTLTDMSPAALAYYPGMIIVCKIAGANTGPMRLQIGALGYKDIKRFDGSDIVPGAAIENAMATFIYDGVKFQAQGALGHAMVTHLDLSGTRGAGTNAWFRIRAKIDLQTMNVDRFTIIGDTGIPKAKVIPCWSNQDHAVGAEIQMTGPNYITGGSTLDPGPYQYKRLPGANDWYDENTQTGHVVGKDSTWRYVYFVNQIAAGYEGDAYNYRVSVHL